MGFARLQENLNYDAAGLLKVFPKYFNRDLAQAYARKPQKIGSRVYANRMGNGNEASGEGYKYRGRGFIQLTGKATYKLFALFCEMTVADALLYLETREGAAYSAGWYWAINNLNDLADLGKFKTITQRINGGQNGAADREAHFKLAKHLFD